MRAGMTSARTRVCLIGNASAVHRCDTHVHQWDLSRQRMLGGSAIASQSPAAGAWSRIHGTPDCRPGLQMVGGA